MKVKDKISLFVLCLLPIAWYGVPLFTEQCYYLGDIMAQYNPWWTYAQKRILSGEFPLWNPYVFGGTPYHVNPENALFYPLKLPLVFFSFFKSIAILRVLNSMVASVGMFLLLRKCGALMLPSLSGAFAFTYGSFMAYEHVHIPYINTAVWFPLELFLLFCLLERPCVRTAVALAAVTASSFLGGSPGVFLICQLTAVFFLLFEYLRLVERRQIVLIGKITAALAFSVCLVITLSSVLLWPAYDFIQFTDRSGGLKDVTNFTDFALNRSGVLTLFFPFFHDQFGAPYPPIYPIPFLNIPYLGVAAVLLSAAVFISPRYRRFLMPAGCIVVLSIAMALGSRSAFFPWLFERVPIFGWFRWPHDYLVMSYLCLAVLFPLGLDVIWREPSKKLKQLLPIMMVYLCLAYALLPTAQTLRACLIGVGVVSSVLLVLLVPLPKSWSRLLRLLSAVAIVFSLGADLYGFSSNYRTYASRDSLQLNHVRDAVEFVRQHAGYNRVAFSTPSAGIYVKGQEEVFRAQIPLVKEISQRNASLTDFEAWLRHVSTSPWAETFWSRRQLFHNLDEAFWDYPVNSSMLMQVQEISGYDPFMLQRVKDLYKRTRFERVWDLFDVRYVVTPHNVLHPDLSLVYSGALLHVYENADRFPRAVVPRTLSQNVSHDEIVEAISKESFDPRNIAYFEESLPASWSDIREGRNHSTSEYARITAYEPERVVLDVLLEAPGVLVVHDVFYPGWRAFSRGEELQIRRVNAVFRAIRLDAGKHRVTLRYAPQNFYYASILTASSWLFVLCSLSVTAMRSRKVRGRINA